MEALPGEAPTTGGSEGVGDVPNDILPPPGTDMTRICFRDELWLNSYPLDRNLVFDYFTLSQFYDVTCNNELLRSRSIHPLDISHLSKMMGSEYMLTVVLEPNLFVLRKQKRDGPEKVTPQLTYYILDGSIYQAPQLCNVFYSRIGRTLHSLSQGLITVASKLEMMNYADSEKESADEELKSVKEPINLKEVKRVDHILTSLLHKLPAAPPPPAFPHGYGPPSTLEEKEKEKEKDESNDTQFCSDPILNQGPSKRMKF